jgi:hypothetical protein
MHTTKPEKFTKLGPEMTKLLSTKPVPVERKKLLDPEMIHKHML